MADTFDSAGLITKTLLEIITELKTSFSSIYGNDINVESNSPDGQLINILAQQAIDIRELITQVNNGFNPDLAEGAVLDQRVAINNITRKGGTYTIVPIDIVVSKTVTLQGLDADFNNADGAGYTVQDDGGNEYILIDTVTLTAGSYTKNFRAREIGAVETTTGTIQTPVTIVDGVTSIDNTSGALSVGIDQETDAQLRSRRQLSVANASSGYLNGLLGTVLNIDGVTDAKVYENYTSATDSNGIPAHSIWLIVEGGANTDIGNAIYEKKSFGAGMKGSVSVDITTASGNTFTASFDRPTADDLYIQFDIQTTITGTVFDQASIKSYIVGNLTFEIGEFVDTSKVTAVVREAIKAQGGGGVGVNVEVSDDDTTWVEYLETATPQDQWTLSTARITITEL